MGKAGQGAYSHSSTARPPESGFLSTSPLEDPDVCGRPTATRILRVRLKMYVEYAPFWLLIKVPLSQHSRRACLEQRALR